MTDPDLPPPADDVALTAPEAAKELRVSEWTVRQLIYTGELHGWRAGFRNYRINRSELDRWLSTTGADSELDADDSLYTVPEVAKKPRVTEWTVRELIKAGRLDAWRAGRRRYRLRTRRRLVMQRQHRPARTRTLGSLW